METVVLAFNSIYADPKYILGLVFLLPFLDYDEAGGNEMLALASFALVALLFHEVFSHWSGLYATAPYIIFAAQGWGKLLYMIPTFILLYMIPLHARDPRDDDEDGDFT